LLTLGKWLQHETPEAYGYRIARPDWTHGVTLAPQPALRDNGSVSAPPLAAGGLHMRQQ
jgi:hypothetical protein